MGGFNIFIGNCNGHEADWQLAGAALQMLALHVSVHARLLEDENARAEKMSDEEKLKFMVDAVRAKPPAIREAFARAVMAGL